jgi:hypothetical protein
MFPFSTIQRIDWVCYSAKGPSWIGEKVLVTDSTNLFFNYKHDTIIIKTNALLNESWLAFDIMDSISIVAQVVKIDTMTFLGLIDTVKTVAFQVFDKTNEPISHKVNDMYLELSRNYGFIEIINFYFFPDYDMEAYMYEQLEHYKLVGLSNPETGIHNLTWFEVFDFQPGDEIHVSYNYSCLGTNSLTVRERSITKYMERHDLPDTITYLTDVYFSRERIYDGNTAYSYQHLQKESIIMPNPQFDLLPGEPVFENDYTAYYYRMVNTKLIFKVQPSAYDHIRGSPEEICWENCCADGCFPSYTYIKGLGGPYHQCSNYTWWCMGGEDNTLVYYKKGNETWGTPLVITDVPGQNMEDRSSVYPNPAKDMVWINIPEINSQFIFQLLSPDGRILLHRERCSADAPIYLDKKLNGLYYYRIITEETRSETGCLLIIQE